MKILLISHSAGRSGAPLVLLGLIKWLKENTNYLLHVLIMQDGPLTDSFRQVADVTLYCDLMNGVSRSLWQRGLRKAGLAFKDDYLFGVLPRKYPRGSVDLIYSNTIVNGEVLHRFRYLEVPVLVHVHELGMLIRLHGEKNLTWNKRYASRYIAVSRAVCDALEGKCAIRSDRIKIIPEPLLNTPDCDRVTGMSRKDVCKEYDIPTDSYIVGGCGAELWRKGKDLFLQVAYYYKRIHGSPEACFVWVGGAAEDADAARIAYDVEKSGLNATVRVIPHVPDATAFMQHFDVFCMTSREDPFPLVNLEAAALGIPLICFADSGGSPEFVDSGMGCIVPYMDTVAMAHKVADLLSDESTRKEMGRKAAAKAFRFLPDSIYPQILTEINALLL